MSDEFDIRELKLLMMQTDLDRAVEMAKLSQAALQIAVEALGHVRNDVNVSRLRAAEDADAALLQIQALMQAAAPADERCSCPPGQCHGEDRNKCRIERNR